MFVPDLDIRIIDAATGVLYRHLTLDPTRRYYGTGRPPGPHPETTTTRPLMGVRAVSGVVRHHMERTTGFEPATLTLAR